MIRQGEVYWVDLGEPSGAEPAYRHPHVVVLNRSRIRTTVLCALASNLDRAASPGNVLLAQGEADLPKRSVVNVSQIFTVDKTDLVERIGALTPARLREVLRGITLLLEPRDVE